MKPSSSGLVVAGLFAFACAPKQPTTLTLQNEPPKPVAPVATTLLPPSTHASARASACLMLYECGCNAGCSEIDQPMSALKAGMQVGVLSGPLKGTAVFVAQSTTDSGEHVLTLQRTDPSSPIKACSIARSAMLGYGCSVKDSGNARACVTCE